MITAAYNDLLCCTGWCNNYTWIFPTGYLPLPSPSLLSMSSVSQPFLLWALPSSHRLQLGVSFENMLKLFLCHSNINIVSILNLFFKQLQPFLESTCFDSSFSLMVFGLSTRKKEYTSKFLEQYSSSYYLQHPKCK